LYTRLGFAHEATGWLTFGAAWDARRRLVVPRSIDGLLLDLGCGEGRLLARFNRRGIAAIGIEPSATMSRRARQAGLTIVRASAQALPLRSDCFLHIVCTYPGPWIIDQATWDEIDRISKPGMTVTILLGGDLGRVNRFSPRRLIMRMAYGDAHRASAPPGLGSARIRGEHCYVEDAWGTAILWKGSYCDID
ncbi:MAG: class I SAM-dependent methyltransferase, partial [Vicinamibacterales bacterium]